MYCSQVRLTSDQSQWWLWSRKIILKSSCFSRQIANVAYGFLSFFQNDSAIFNYYRICITSLYILTPEIIIFRDSKNFRRGFYTVLCGRGNGWKVNVIHPDAYEIGFIWSPTAYSWSPKIKAQYTIAYYFSA